MLICTLEVIQYFYISTVEPCDNICHLRIELPKSLAHGVHASQQMPFLTVKVTHTLHFA